MIRTVLLLCVLVLAACRTADAPAEGTVGRVLPEGVLFFDDFSPGLTGSWVLERDDIGQTAVQDDRLVITINAPSTLQFATLADQTFSDFVLEAEVRQLQGSLDSSFGLLFRLVSPQQFYRFDITGSGLYMLERRNADGTWTRFINDWLESPAINQGLNAPNRLKVTAVGPSLRFYVNDIQLQEISDATYSLGTIALDGGTFGQPGLQVSFDEVQVSQPVN